MLVTLMMNLGMFGDGVTPVVPTPPIGGIGIQHPSIENEQVLLKEKREKEDFERNNEALVLLLSQWVVNKN